MSLKQLKQREYNQRYYKANRDRILLSNKNSFKKLTPNTTCGICSKRFYLSPAHARRVKVFVPTCSRICKGISHRGEGNPAWKDNFIQCHFCQKPYKPHTNNGGKKFCSAKCMGQDKHARRSLSTLCGTCGETLVIQKSWKRKVNYCSIHCKNQGHSDLMTGSGNSNWKEGISLEPYDFTFSRKLKRFIRNRHNNQCFICGKHAKDNLCGIGYNLVVHHIDYNKKNSTEGNLVPLCNPCHGKTHYNRPGWSQRLSLQLRKFLETTKSSTT